MNRIMSLMMNKAPLIAGLSLLMTCAMAQATTDTGMQSKLSLESLDDTDLGTAKGGDLNAATIDVKPWVYWQQNDWRAYGMAEGFAASDTVEYESSASDPGSDGFVGVREAWVDYTGFTQYPGEYFRTGLQRVRSNDGLWWDTDIEATRWIFDTTLIDAEIGAAQRFALYRSDESDVPNQDEDRRHLFGKYRYQWHSGHWVAARFHQLSDGKSTQGLSANPAVREDIYSNLRWLGVELDSDYYRPNNDNALNYQLGAVMMDGQRKDVGRSRLQENVGGTLTEALVRYRLGHWQFGAATAMSSGEITDNEDNRYLQTGLESNRSAFTGTRARIFRFGETYRASLGNLNVYSLFASYVPTPATDVSVVLHRFERRNALAPTDSAIVAKQVDRESDLGQELDIVFSRYLNSGVLSPEWAVEDSAYFRLRGGLFAPGSAYGEGVDSSVLHLTGEFVWLF